MLEFALALLQALPGLVEQGTAAYEAVKAGNAALAAMAAQSRGPSDAEWDALNATVTGELAQLKD